MVTRKSRRLTLVSAGAGAMTLVAISGCGATSAGSAGAGRGSSAYASSAPDARKGPDGAGGLLARGVWSVRAFKGKEVPYAFFGTSVGRPWIELHDDGTASGAYGCEAFRMEAKLGAAELTLGGKAGEPPKWPGPQKKARCGDEVTYAEGAVQYEEGLKAFLQGPLTITEKPEDADPESAKPRSPRSSLELKNDRGETVTLVPNRPEEFFDTRYRPVRVQVYDSPYGFDSGTELYFDCHPDGTVTGQLGCNDFTAKADFAGTHVFFHDPELATDHSCSEKERDDAQMVLPLLKSQPYQYVADRDGMTIRWGDDPYITTLDFTGSPRP